MLKKNIWLSLGFIMNKIGLMNDKDYQNFKFNSDFFFMIFISIILCISFVSAVPPINVLQSSERGVDIIHPETPYIKYNTDLEINFWTYNSTTGATLTNQTLNCTAYILDNTGTNFYIFSNNIGANGLIHYGKGSPLCVNCWTMIMPKENLSIQLYSYQIKCQGVNIGGYSTGYFEVTADGREPIGDSFRIFYYILFIILICSIIYITIINISKLATTSTTIIDVIISWSIYFVILLFYWLTVTKINNMLLWTFVNNIFMNITFAIIFIILPLVSLIITMIYKGFEKNNNLSIEELLGRRIIHG